MARDELRKDERKLEVLKKDKERAERDAAIAAKQKEEGKADEQDERIAAGLKSNA